MTKHQSESGNMGSGEFVDLPSVIAQKPINDGEVSRSEVVDIFVSQDFPDGNWKRLAAVYRKCSTSNEHASSKSRF